MNDLNSLILSCLIFCPIVGAILVALLPRRIALWGALAVALLTFALALHPILHWNDGDVATGGFRFEQKMAWLPDFGVSYHLGIDGLSVFLILLTAFLTPLVILAAWNSVADRVKEFVICLLLLEAATIGVFCALDLILFYVFFEAVLIPTYILIVGWGGAKRAAAGLKFFIYTMAGSVLMWLAMLYMYKEQSDSAGRSFDYDAMKTVASTLEGKSDLLMGAPVATVLFFAFAIAFAIKAPLFPLHTWQADTYSEAPTAATVMLAALLSKMGIYGFMRFAIPFFPQTARELAPLFMTLAIIGIIYGALVAIVQTDIKRLLAYSSLSHVSLIVLGVFAATMTAKNADLANTGAALQMVNHGLSTGALFLLAGFLIERRQRRNMGDFGGLAKLMPRYSVLFWIALFASIGLPGLNGFVGEYLILQGTMSAGFWYAALAATTVVLGAIYMLRMFRDVMFGEVTHEENRVLRDVNPRETLVMALVLGVIVWIGVRPQGFLDIIGNDANNGSAPSAQALPKTWAQAAPKMAQR
jgi:NADH-quinone oxidoreductase subunit M